MEITTERLSAKELAALDGAGLVSALCEIIAELNACKHASQLARHAVTDAKKVLRRNKQDDSAFDALCDAKTAQDDLKDRVSTLKEHKSILQTIIRGTPV